jgi:hypothetical protein
MRRSFHAILISVACLFFGCLLVGRQARAADPTTADCLNASEASLTLRNQHRLREARAQLLVCSAASCPGDIRDECIRRVEMVNASMPTVVFEAKDAAGNDLSAVRVAMDGQPLVDRLEGTALSIDPGEHVFIFETAGQPPVQKQMVIREGEKGRRERVSFPAIPDVVLPMPIPPTPAPVPASFGTQRILAVVAAGLGVVGLGLGIGFGIDAISKHDDAKKVCPDRCTDQKGVDLWDKAVSSGNISTVGFIVGTVGLAGGAVLWFTAKTPTGEGMRAGAVVGIGPGSLQLRGAW